MNGQRARKLRRESETRFVDGETTVFGGKLYRVLKRRWTRLKRVG